MNILIVRFCTLAFILYNARHGNCTISRSLIVIPRNTGKLEGLRVQDLDYIKLYSLLNSILPVYFDCISACAITTCTSDFKVAVFTTRMFMKRCTEYVVLLSDTAVQGCALPIQKLNVMP